MCGILGLLAKEGPPPALDAIELRQLDVGRQAAACDFEAFVEQLRPGEASVREGFAQGREHESRPAPHLEYAARVREVAAQRLAAASASTPLSTASTS